MPKIRIEGIRAWKITYDTYIKANKPPAKIIAKIKKQRKKYNEKVRKFNEKIMTKQEGKRNLNLLSKKQVKKQNRKQSKFMNKRKRLHYVKSGGDLAFRGVLSNGNKWNDNFVSSNVYRFKTRRNNLVIQFLDGSTYLYWGVAKLFLGLLNANSKGKWVWRRLIKANISFHKLT